MMRVSCRNLLRSLSQEAMAMGYAEKHLMEGERIVYRARLHRVIFVPPLVLALVGAVAAILIHIYLANPMAAGIVGVAFLIVALLVASPRFIRYMSSEFVVTNKRVIVKVGFVQRQTLELVLAKVETIGVEQTILGRILNYGTIIVTGTGGTKEPFKDIASPIRFREHVQAQLA
jgi:uncharacterized membrane protein YdbT with pleckstrin-like domain